MAAILVTKQKKMSVSFSLFVFFSDSEVLAQMSLSVIMVQPYCLIAFGRENSMWIHCSIFLYTVGLLYDQERSDNFQDGQNLSDEQTGTCVHTKQKINRDRIKTHSGFGPSAGVQRLPSPYSLGADSTFSRWCWWPWEGWTGPIRHACSPGCSLGCLAQW